MERAQPSQKPRASKSLVPRSSRPRNPSSGRRSAGNGALVSLLHVFNSPVVPAKDECDLLYEMAFSSGDLRSFSNLYLLAEVFSKWQEGGEDAVRQQAAMSSFLDGEQQCAVTNRRLVWDPYPSQKIERVMGIAQRLLAKLLGEFDYESFISLCNHGSGATAGLPRRSASPQNKWENEPTITAEGLKYYLALSQYIGNHVPLPAVTVVPGDTITTVIKNAVTHRVIGKGPGWNVFFQKGLGRMLRLKLWKKGLLLASAQSHHGKLARQGSLTGRLATVDLKNASSTISYGLVELLLKETDPRWLATMVDLRSRAFSWDAESTGLSYSGTYEMFSAMGNGYTFELETALFWSLAKACCISLGCGSSIEECSVYGDDIVVPTVAVDLVREVFSHCGLTFNVKKSHWAGPFRESCGSHYWNGRDVTPFYVKSTPRTLPDLITLHNKASAWCARTGSVSVTWEAFLRQLREAIPRRLWGPPHISDCAWVPFHLQGGVWHRRRQCWVQDTCHYDSTIQVEPDRGGLTHFFWLRKDAAAIKRVDCTDLESLILSESRRAEKGRVVYSRVHHDGDSWYGHVGRGLLYPGFFVA